MILFILIGIFCIYLGVHSILREYKDNKRCNLSINAKVIKIDEIDDNNVRPIFEYRVNNKDYNGKLNLLKSRNKYKVGDTIIVKCNKSNPSDYIEPGRNNLYLVGVIAIIMGIVFIISKI